jgi:hypothetical protein
LNQATSSRVYLILPDNSEIEVSGWKVAEPPPANPGDPPRLQTVSRIVLDLPANVNAVPDSTHAPFPNVYLVRVGSDPARGDKSFYRSNATPISVAAWISSPAYPTSPILAPNADGSFTLKGRGFIPGNTEVLLGAVVLTAAPGAAVNKGQFFVTDQTTIVFMPPDALPKGLLAVRVRVNRVEADPSLWIQR